ncbi:MAG TPA: GNAT family N-acetyltransferase [Mycobacteriales bacterium]|nr:GNAT family N-acetyltransferase [Mycobacteriales bacterium]
MSDETNVSNSIHRHRFEISVEGEAAGFTTYRDHEQVRTFVHTEVDPSFEGRGIGGRLIRAALDQTRADGMRVEPECPFVRAFIEKHAEYADLVDAA